MSDKKLPIIPPLEKSPSIDKPIAICGECGIKLYRVMAYSCPKSNCPCGFGNTNMRDDFYKYDGEFIHE